MKSDDKESLLKKIAELEKLVDGKNAEIVTYRKELIRFSQKLDSIMSQFGVDMQMLAKLQKILSPTELPHIPGFEVSRKFVYGSKYGGDYFDIFEHEDRFRFGLLVAASSGYAMSALFLSLILKVSHVLEAKKGNPPEKVMQQIAEDLKELAKGNDSTNVFYAVIDRRDYSFKFCSAGNIQGFYLAPNKPLQLISSTHSSLSQNFNETLSSISLELEPNSRVCLVTNGLTDVLGLDKIAQIVNDTAKSGVHELRNELLFQAQIVSGLPEPIRDQTVVVIEVKDKVIKLAK